MPANVYLIPAFLSEGATECLPAYILTAVKNCSVFFVENERSARRYLKLLWREMVIDDYAWFPINEIIDETISAFRQAVRDQKNIGIISEAGCPGVADPGQQLVAIAQEMKATVKPLVGPNSILLALMASGMNGQQFSFQGYLPIDAAEKLKAIRSLEQESRNRKETKIFIETPYRNQQLFEILVKTCHPLTRLCVAKDLTGAKEWVLTATIKEWKNQVPELHKIPAIFLLQA